MALLPYEQPCIIQAVTLNHLFSIDLGSGPKYPAQKAVSHLSASRLPRLKGDDNRKQLTTWN